MRTIESIAETLAEGEDNRHYSCDFCGWAEQRADLQACTSCALVLACRDCRDQLGHCIKCAEFDLPESIEIVGTNFGHKVDIQIEVRTWIGVCIASHYHVDIRQPGDWNRYGRLVIPDHLSHRTERPERIMSYIRRTLKVLAHRYRNAIRKRKDKKLYVSIDHNETVQRFMKRGLFYND